MTLRAAKPTTPDSREQDPTRSLQKPCGDDLLPLPADPALGPAAPTQWPVRGDLTLLNHASYGLTPRYVRRRQAQIQDLMDEDPPTFFVRWLEPLADRARRAIAGVAGCEPSDLALVPNGTVAVATVIQNAPLQPGDEILATTHEYNATLNELRLQAQRRGVTVRLVNVPLMPEGSTGPGDSRADAKARADAASDQIAETVLAAIGEKTRLLIVSHLASATSLRFPVERIVRGAEERGVDTLVDGAHAPGQIPLDIASLRPAYYAASCHKWLNAPKGSGFLWVRPDLQPRMRTIAQSCRVHVKRADRCAFLCDFDYMGTGDYSAMLTVPDAIAHIAHQARGWLDADAAAALSTKSAWLAIMDRNADLARRGADRVLAACHHMGVRRAFPAGLFACMHSLILPASPDPTRPRVYDDALQDRLWHDHRIQVPVWTFQPDGGPGTRIIRISANLHNSIEQYDKLAAALAHELANEAQQGDPRPSA